MALSRYTFSKRTHGGKVIEPSKASYRIYHAVQSGGIKTAIRVLEEGERLDQIAGVTYGDASLWWIIAAASGIGWTIQVPPGTQLRVPLDPGEAFTLLS